MERNSELTLQQHSNSWGVQTETTWTRKLEKKHTHTFRNASTYWNRRKRVITKKKTYLWDSSYFSLWYLLVSSSAELCLTQLLWLSHKYFSWTIAFLLEYFTLCIYRMCKWFKIILQKPTARNSETCPQSPKFHQNNLLLLSQVQDCLLEMQEIITMVSCKSFSKYLLLIKPVCFH